MCNHVCLFTDARVQTQVLMLREQVPLTTQTNHLSHPKTLCSTSFIHYLLLDVPSARDLTEHFPFVGGEGGQMTVTKAQRWQSALGWGVLTLLVTVPWPITVPFRLSLPC